MRNVIRFSLLAALVAATASCGDAARSSRSPVFLVVNSLTAAMGNHPTTFGGTLISSVVTNVTTPPPCAPATPCPTVFNDIGQVILSLAMKDTTIAPTSNNQVTITSYHVAFTRADGRNVQGQDVPYAFDGAITLTLPPSGTATAAFEIVRNVAKEEAPLVQLVSSPNIISTIATVTFYGKDQVGNDVSVAGSILIDFGNFANT
jgi:hypothetical protein